MQMHARLKFCFISISQHTCVHSVDLSFISCYLRVFNQSEDIIYRYIYYRFLLWLNYTLAGQSWYAGARNYGMYRHSK